MMQHDMVLKVQMQPLADAGKDQQLSSHVKSAVQTVPLCPMYVPTRLPSSENHKVGDLSCTLLHACQD